jgi:DNA primase
VKVYDKFVKKEATSSSNLSKSWGGEVNERYFAEVLIRWGTRIYDRTTNTTVAEYIIANIQDVIHEFESRLYQKIAQETEIALKRGQLLNIHYFLNHQEDAIKQLSIEVLTPNPEHEYADWEGFGVALHTQKKLEENFELETPQAILRFKFNKITKISQHNATLIKSAWEANDEVTALKHMKIQDKLDAIRKLLAKELGIVVLK